jgi:Flp pilus assembly pilin Flp
MIALLKDLLKEESGQDTLEYVFIGLIVALSVIAGMSTFAASVNQEFGKLGTGLT